MDCAWQSVDRIYGNLDQHSPNILSLFPDVKGGHSSGRGRLFRCWAAAWQGLRWCGGDLHDRLDDRPGAGHADDGAAAGHPGAGGRHAGGPGGMRVWVMAVGLGGGPGASSLEDRGEEGKGRFVGGRESSETSQVWNGIGLKSELAET